MFDAFVCTATVLLLIFVFWIVTMCITYDDAHSLPSQYLGQSHEEVANKERSLEYCSTTVLCKRYSLLPLLHVTKKALQKQSSLSCYSRPQRRDIQQSRILRFVTFKSQTWGSAIEPASEIRPMVRRLRGRSALRQATSSRLT